MRVRTRHIASAILFPGFLWLLITILEPLGRSGLLGPVLARNLECRLDAGALFYTEVELPDAEPKSSVPTSRASRGIGFEERAR